ncbi:methylated-DNA--[protein]-cysteine S-methyltransferase [Burkholderia sp. FERM BP-3421]|jgi:methylated-DNA-[protein]-cysteine S-methyltransferase|uniref:methylated-DNA--[protein]-cysteine S-methyltransferase n=1 Tax=Burkholderia sp. FERM BP-3421 TaxID=1494466 RepID=UPI002361E710|nr:methylated-DNA--[protein]-cysteine S-methyltransferase [Burkholderia sp. FERM BP-3421]WDD95099.1 methylated-DNA--[protein]-cysteine S-methyltransferase [Burkholderia sp. FERM BP-3421]
MFNAVIDAPFGKVGIRTGGGLVQQILYVPVSVRDVAPDSALAKRAVRQIERYFERASARFDLPLAPVGTAFQQRVWAAIREIPPGVVRTYGQIAKEVGTGPRAVGQACGANYFSFVIPCHRVVAAGGIGPYAHGDTDGYYLQVKRWLLAHEGIQY